MSYFRAERSKKKQDVSIRNRLGLALLRALDAMPDGVFVMVPIIVGNLLVALPGVLVILCLGWFFTGSVNPCIRRAK